MFLFIHVLKCNFWAGYPNRDSGGDFSLGGGHEYSGFAAMSNPTKAEGAGSVERQISLLADSNNG